MKIGPDGIALIKSFEGCAKERADSTFEAYPDPGSGGDPWTIGWGSTGPDIKRGTVWTQAQCDERFAEHVAHFADGVARALGAAATTQHQFDAMVSLHYNTGALLASTLFRMHKAGDFTGAKAQFSRWNKASGKIMAGLVRRRAAEAALYGAP